MLEQVQCSDQFLISTAERVLRRKHALPLVIIVAVTDSLCSAEQAGGQGISRRWATNRPRAQDWVTIKDDSVRRQGCSQCWSHAIGGAETSDGLRNSGHTTVGKVVVVGSGVQAGAGAYETRQYMPLLISYFSEYTSDVALLRRSPLVGARHADELRCAIKGGAGDQATVATALAHGDSSGSGGDSDLALLEHVAEHGVGEGCGRAQEAKGQRERLHCRMMSEVQERRCKGWKRTCSVNLNDRGARETYIPLCMVYEMLLPLGAMVDEGSSLRILIAVMAIVWAATPIRVRTLLCSRPAREILAMLRDDGVLPSVRGRC